MKLPFAVYTARDGYAWQSGTEAGTGKLERLRKAIGKMPEFDFGDSASSGMLNAGDDIVLYRFMRQEKADSHGRAALYLAMTFFPRGVARFINADLVLSAPPFAQPLKEPPSWFDYNGPPAMPSDFIPPKDSGAGNFDQAGSMAKAGFVFSKPINGNLHISRKEPNDGKGCLFQYSLPAPTKKKVMCEQPSPMNHPFEAPLVRQTTTAIWKWTAVAAVILAILEAFALIYLTHVRVSAQPTPVGSMEGKPQADQELPPQPQSEQSPTTEPEPSAMKDATSPPDDLIDQLKESPSTVQITPEDARKGAAAAFQSTPIDIRRLPREKLPENRGEAEKDTNYE